MSLKYNDRDVNASAPYIFDWSAQMTADSDTITGATVSILAGTPDDLVLGDPSVVGSLVSYRISGGTVGKLYQIECEITTTKGNTFRNSTFIKTKVLNG